jgi:hypothetical protein
MTESQMVAYCEWKLFAKEMSETDLSCFEPANEWARRLRNKSPRLGGRVDWEQLGMPSFKGGQIAQAIIDSVKANTHLVANDLLLKHWRCLLVLAKSYQLGPEAFSTFVSITQHEISDYLVVYQSLKHTKYTLAKLRTLARENHAAYPQRCARHKISWAIAYHLSLRWGFNHFAVKSQLNDDVLTKIKSFL